MHLGDKSCPDLVLFRYLPPGGSVEITFDLPPAGWDKALGESSFTYRPGYMTSAAACSLFDASTLGGFVTVTPIATECHRSDLDGDGDVDLHDFAQFQSDFTGPKEPD